MAYQGMAARYLENDVLSRSPEWLVPLIYEHLLQNLRRAAKQIEARDTSGRAASLGKASTLLFELMGTLDAERGGPIADQLSALYGFLTTELIDIGRRNDARRLERVIGIVSELHEAFRQAAEQVAPRGGTARAVAV